MTGPSTPMSVLTSGVIHNDVPKLARGKGTLRNEGLFTPPSFEGSIEMPGHNGGANWGGSAVDPQLGYIFVNTKDAPAIGWKTYVASLGALDCLARVIDDNLH